jgi:hypothetical protein
MEDVPLVEDLRPAIGREPQPLVSTVITRPQRGQPDADVARRLCESRFRTMVCRLR